MYQSGTQDPIEGICYYNNTNNLVRGKIVIHRLSGLTKRLEMFVLGGQVEEYNTPAGSIFGHSGVPGVLTIGAIAASDPGNDNIEPFSSRGPSRIDFPSVQNHPKPDLIAIDGVSVTGTGGFPSTFFGTSAAAPHAAGVAALLKQAAPMATPVMIRTALMSSAVDLGISGQDNIFGSGRINALAALMVIAPDTDNDDDGILDKIDNCPDISNVNQEDIDNDGVGDACDTCPLDSDNDIDNDGICGNVDNCPNIYNSNQTNSDGDSLGNACDGCPIDTLKTSPGICGCGVADTDSDGDGTADCNDSCSGDPLKTDPGLCGCGVADTDSDSDGTANCNDLCVNDPNKTNPGICGCGVADTDSDGDGIADCIDADVDGDGISNADEVQCGSDPMNPNSKCGRFLPFLMLLLD
jgi:hypothetical protein